MTPANSSTKQSFFDQPWRLWFTQLRAMVRLENGRNLFSWRGAWVYFLAFAPTFIIFIHTIASRNRNDSMSQDTNILAGDLPVLLPAARDLLRNAWHLRAPHPRRND